MYFIVPLWAIVFAHYRFCDLHCWMHKTVHILGNFLLSYFLREGNVWWVDWNCNKEKKKQTTIILCGLQRESMLCFPAATVGSSAVIRNCCNIIHWALCQDLLRRVIPESIRWFLECSWLAGLLGGWEKLVCQAILAVILQKTTTV